MSTLKQFEDMELWQKSRIFAREIYSITHNSPLVNDFALKEQIRRSASSIMDNIAEGFERGGNREFIQFLSIAKGSAGETCSQLYRSFDLKYIDEQTFSKLQSEAKDISKMISRFITYLKNTEHKGIKFKTKAE